MPANTEKSVQASWTVHPPVVERARIAIRERPASDEELPQTQVILRTDHEKLVAFAPQSEDGLMYDYDYLFSQNTRQEDVYRTIGLEMVDLVMGGLSANCITVGAAETGKTHTLFGSTNESGLIQDTVSALFQRLEEQAHEHTYHVSFSYWEMSCDEVNDTIAEAYDYDVSRGGSQGSPKSRHSIYRDGLGRLYVSHICDVDVQNFEEFNDLLNVGNEYRIRAGYDRLFRWHGFVQLSVMTVDKIREEHCVLRRMTFVHTKGPERVGSNAARKKVLWQGSKINVSCTLLNAAVIHSLEYRAKRERRCANQKELHDLIRRSASFFMECRYTQMMSQLMCGHEACFVIGCVDPLSYKETIDTLEMLQLFRQIRAACIPVVTLSAKGHLLRQLRAKESGVGGAEVLESIYSDTSGRPRTEEEEALLELRGRIENWGNRGATAPAEDGDLKEAEATTATVQPVDEGGSKRTKRKKNYLNATKTATYEGEWRNNVFDGFGEHVAANFKYRGEFRNGQRDGQGTLFLRDSKESPYHRVYEGEWLAGKRDGRGTQWCSNGEVYEGDFAVDERHGNGKLYLVNGDIIEGQFRHGLCEGWAALHQPEGDWFEGFWVGGVREGPGLWHYVSRKQCLRGEWSNNISVMGVIEDDPEKEDTTCGRFIPRIGLPHIDKLLGTERERLNEHRELTFRASGKQWVDYAVLGNRNASESHVYAVGAASVPTEAEKSQDTHTVYGMEIE